MTRLRSQPLWWILSAGFGMIFYVSSVLADEGVKYRSQGKRDPFVSLVAYSAQTGTGFLSIESLDEIVVQGIIYDPKQGSMAMANGIFLKEGEESGNVKLIKVNSDSAVFVVNGVEGTKTLYPRENLNREAN